MFSDGCSSLDSPIDDGLVLKTMLILADGDDKKIEGKRLVVLKAVGALWKELSQRSRKDEGEAAGLMRRCLLQFQFDRRRSAALDAKSGMEQFHERGAGYFGERDGLHRIWYLVRID